MNQTQLSLLPSEIKTEDLMSSMVYAAFVAGAFFTQSCLEADGLPDWDKIVAAARDYTDNIVRVSE